MAENNNKPSNPIRKDIHTTLSDILDFGTDKITIAPTHPTPESTNQRLKKLIQQLQDLNKRVDRLIEG